MTAQNTNTGHARSERREPADPGVEATVARPGGISYLGMPALDAVESAEFYRAVFGWEVRGDSDSLSFSDGTGHVSGTGAPTCPPPERRESAHTSMSPGLMKCCAQRQDTARTSSPRPSRKAA